MEGNPDDVSEDSYHSDNLSEDYYSDHLCEDEEVDDYELAASASPDEASPDEASPEGFILFLNSLIYHIDSRMREMRHMEVRPQPECFQTHSQVRAIFHFRMHLTQSYPAASTELRMAYLMARTVDFDRKNLRQHLFEDLSLQILTMAMQNEHGPALEFLSVFPDASMSVIVRVMMEVLSPPPESILFCFDCLTQVGVQNFLCNGCSLPYYFELEHESLLPHITTGDAEFRFSRGLLPASRTFLESLKPSQATCKEIDKDSVSCSICRVEFELGVNDEILLLPCNHQFHPNCILRWFNERSTCPNCRVVMPLTAHTPLLVPRTSFEVGESSHTTGEIREPNREDVYDTTAPSTSSSSAPSTSGGAEPSHPKEEGGEQDRSATSGRSQQSEPNDKNPNPDESAMQRLHALVANIQELSNVNDISRLHQLLKQAEQSLKAAATQLAHLLSLLDPAQHSLGYLYILDAFISGPKTEEKAGEHVSTVTRFIDSCAQDQIHFAPQKFVSVCKKFKDDVMMLRMSIRGVAPMRTAVRKLQSSSGYLTTLHPDFLTLCLLAKCYKVGYSILEEDIFEIDHPRDVFLYCYYGGMICIGQKDYRKAMELLHNVVTAPMTTLSAIAVQAHRKYILVSLIHNGQLSDSFSKSNSAMTPQTLKNFSQHYYDLADSYSTGKISQLESCLLANRVKFERDNNLGLVKQVVTSLYKRNIQRLTQTYLTLSLQDIADRTQLNTPKEAEMHVLQMIQDGEIYATVNQKDSMITFHEDPEQYKTWSTSEHIESLIQRIMSLSKRLSTVNEYISYDVAYLTKVGKDRPGHDLNDFDGTPHGFGRDRSGFDDFDGVPSDYSHF